MFFVILLLTTVLLSMSVAVPVVAAGPLSQEHKVDVPYNDISAYDICAGDVDGDGDIEIVSVGYADDGSGSRGLLAIGTWNGEDAASEGGEQFLVDGMGTWVYGVDVGDLDGDGFSEIVITGECDDGIHHHSWIRVYRWTGTTLTLLDTERWTLVDAWSNHVVVGDLDGDDAPEIVTCGGVYDGIEERCQLRVWSPSLTLEESEEWYTVGDTWAITVLWPMSMGMVRRRL